MRPYLRCAAVALALSTGTLRAQTSPSAASSGPEPASPAATGSPVPGRPAVPEAGAAQSSPTGFWDRSNLLGDPGDLRAKLTEYGISYGLTETSEVLGNATGGRRQQLVYEGVLEASVGVDLEKALGLPGGIINVSAFQIHGRGLTTNAVDNLNVVSSVEADRSTRLFELWYQQSFLGGKVDLKVGQQSADLEFIVSQYAQLFVNSGFGWPTLTAVDLPSGGAAYPLATPAVRLRVQPTESITTLLGVFNGSPAGLGLGDPQRRNASGTTFDTGSGVFVIGEVQVALNQGENATGLPGAVKLGAWYNSNAFTDQFFTSSPITAANGLGLAPSRRHDWSVYAVADQLVFRPEGSKDGGAGVFLRAMGAPGDRNLINVFVDGGVTYKGAFGRDNDTMGLAFGWARISDAAVKGDRAVARASGGFYPIRDSEVIIEATYQVTLAPWWTVQPDIQYVIHPGGGILNPDKPGKRIGDALVFGARTGITF